MRVLVAEDDEGLREVLVLGLTDAGYHVDAVERGDDAIDQLTWYEYDVAVIDWRMPGAEGIDVVAAILDPYLRLGLTALVPFAASWRPVPMALGVISMDLVVALIATSLLRKHLGQRAWRLVHWTSYLMWPMALVHTVTTGTDALTPWMLAIEAVCLAIVAGAATWRWVDRGATMVLGARSLAR